MIELIKSIKSDLKQSIRNKWRNSVIGNVFNFIGDKIIPILVYMYFILNGILATYYLATSKELTDAIFSFIMTFTWYGIYVVWVTRRIHKLVSMVNTSMLDKIETVAMYFIFIFMSMSFIFFKVAAIRNFTDTLTISPLNIIFMGISVFFYPKNLKYLISKSKKARDIVITSLVIGVFINLLLISFSRMMVILGTIQIYFLLSVTIFMRNFKPEEYSENNFGIIVRDRKYPKIEQQIIFVDNWKNEAFVVIRSVFCRISAPIKPIAFKIFINITAIAIEIFLSSRAYDVFNYIVILPDSKSFIFIHLEALTMMGLAILMWGVQMLYFLTESYSVGIKIIDINKFFLVILFAGFGYQVIHAPILTILSIIWYVALMKMMKSTNEPRYKKAIK
ncbi:hypothetical protein FDC58_15540 [Clostridium botulinum]|uniref:hypothetical protein n=1 Tax=unclassified Clostridium TaxID=2614128 RepID=UPI0013C69E51|nr:MULTISPECIES: hypothetical protein [unclassified Clostridium]MBY7008400.1 hypothetical protein [Clostridium botulinum]NFH73035.1 hypothetical protein [Clostridium botulinum]NFI01201.1 hypothetical protein [Clostridium botulinum]NFI63580.1 hypothetical protein [Clostridium botulinum]NFI81812.1 hypothetical protein [Clostridium botulinum]